MAQVIVIEEPIARCRQCGLLHFELGLSYKKTAGVLKRLFGLTVTPGGLAQAMSRLGKRCLPTYEALKDAIGQSSVVTGDETSWRVMALAAWMWHFTTPTLALYGIRSGRGYAEAVTLLPETFVGILVSDGWAVYRRFLEAQRQSCVAHLMRRGHELKELAHGRGREIPGLVLRLLGDAPLVRDRRDAGELTEVRAPGRSRQPESASGPASEPSGSPPSRQSAPAQASDQRA